MEKENLRILLIDLEDADHRMVRRSLDRSGIPQELKWVNETAIALKKIPKGRFDLILTDHQPPGISAPRLIQFLNEQDLKIPVILLTRDAAVQRVRDSFKWGVCDFLLKEELEAISLLEVVTGVIEKVREVREVQAYHDQLREASERDGLTRLYNHRYLLETLEREFQRSRRYWRPLSLLMIDLDGFKAINDQLGHPTGDQALIRIAEILSRSIRKVDLVARYGGDEFAVLLPETPRRHAIRIAERILKEIRRHPVLEGEKIFPLSASIGLATFHPGLLSAGAFLREADQALYCAKREGRNRLGTPDSPSGEYPASQQVKESRTG